MAQGEGLVVAARLARFQMSDEDESEIEDDERIMKVLMFLDKHTPAETATYLRDELGGQDALVYGTLFVGKPCHARAHFLLMGIPLNEAKPLPEQQPYLMCENSECPPCSGYHVYGLACFYHT